MHDVVENKMVQQIETHPLVSIVVLTFNSAATLLQTLDSLLQQDYSPIEIIICDDGSKDATLSVAEKWITENEKYFKRIVILAATANQGICSNVHKGYAEAKGTWIKPIAGDDFIFPGAIGRYVEFAQKADCAVIVAAVLPFVYSSRINISTDKVIPAQKDIDIIAGPANKLQEALYVRNIIPAPGIFLNRSHYNEVGGIDRRFFHLDDWPLWLNLLAKNKTFTYLAEPMVAYRISETTISAAQNATSMNRQFLEDHLTLYKHYQVAHLGLLQRWDRMLEIFRFKLAKDVLRPYPRIYKMTGLLRLTSPLYLALKLGISKNAREKLDSQFVTR